MIMKLVNELREDEYNYYLLWHIQQLVQVDTSEGEFTESTLLANSFIGLSLERKKDIAINKQIFHKHFIFNVNLLQTFSLPLFKDTL